MFTNESWSIFANLIPLIGDFDLAETPITAIQPFFFYNLQRDI